MNKHYVANWQLKVFYDCWLGWKDSPLAFVRRDALKAKTLGLIHYDRTMCADK